jgi:hypothetical protein
MPNFLSTIYVGLNRDSGSVHSLNDLEPASIGAPYDQRHFASFDEREQSSGSAQRVGRHAEPSVWSQRRWSSVCEPWSWASANIGSRRRSSFCGNSSLDAARAELQASSAISHHCLAQARREAIFDPRLHA